MMTGLGHQVCAWSGNYCGVRWGTRVLIVLVLAACRARGASAPTPAPGAAVASPARVADTATFVPVEERLEFRIADSLPFPGSEVMPRLFDERRVYAAVAAVVHTAEFRHVEAAINEQGMPVLNLELCAVAGARLARVTAARIGGQIMILAGNTVLSVAVITGEVGDRVQVAGLGTVGKTMAFAAAVQPRLRRSGCRAAP